MQAMAPQFEPSAQFPNGSWTQFPPRYTRTASYGMVHSALLNSGRCVRMRDGYDSWAQTDRDACAEWEKAPGIKIDGGGVIDGGGWNWWSQCPPIHAPPECARPQTLDLAFADGLQVTGVTVQNSPSWTIHVLESSDVEFRNITVLSPPWPHSRNTDGIDLDSVRGAEVTGSRFRNGDDGIALWAGAGPVSWAPSPPLPAPGPTRDVLVEDCTFENSHGLTVTEFLAGGVSNVTFRRIKMVDPLAGPHIKAKRGIGGGVQGVLFEDIEILGTQRHSETRGWNGSGFALVIDMYTDCSGAPGGGGCPSSPVNDSLTPKVEGVTVRNVSCRAPGCWGAAQLLGLPESPIRELRLDWVDLKLVDPQCPGLTVAHGRGQVDNSSVGVAESGSRCFQCAFLDSVKVGPGGAVPRAGSATGCQGIFGALVAAT